MTSVTFPVSVGGDGSTVSDDSNVTTGLKANGHRTRFVLALAQLVNIALWVANAATAIAGLLATAGTVSTSTTSVAVGTGAKTWTTQTGKTWAQGMWVMVADTAAPSTNWCWGIVTAYNSGTGQLDVDVKYIGGSGTKASWSISLTGAALTQATASDVRIGTNTLNPVTPAALTGSAAVQTLTDAATVAWNAQNGYNAEVTLGGNRLIGNITNPQDGMVYSLDLIQDATGSRIPTWDTMWDFGAAGAPLLQTGAGKRDAVAGKYRSSTGKIYASVRRGA